MGKRVLEIIIAGDASGAQKAFAAVEGSGTRLSGVMRGIGRAATLGLGAVVAGAGASVVAASTFQDSMREVFTLLPGISGEAMGAMSSQVKDLSNEFGVMPNDVVPALYSALSAGVPQDNVFDFLEVAQKAAKGGVTDLATAVDGISSVMNAYGSDVIGATEASDLMFTAVRLGKTNMEELSRSLFNVTPTAAALGVGFADVTASIAALTAQGVPTSVASTQMRAALVELGKEGSVAFDSFVAATGSTFPDFIAAGGNLSEAVAAMATQADDTGTSMLNLFGSVEAGGAFTALAANAEGFDQILGEMGASAGATQTAFETMDTGLSATLDRLKARLATTAITAGEFLLPKFESISTWALDKGIPAISGLIERFTPLAADIRDKAITALGFLKDKAETVFGFLSEKIPPIVDTVRGAVVGGFETIRDKVGPIATAIKDGVVLSFEQIRDVLDPVIDTIRDGLVVAFEELGDLLEPIGDYIVDDLIPAIEDLTMWFGENGIAGVVDKAKEAFDRVTGALRPWLPLIGGAAAMIGAALVPSLVASAVAVWAAVPGVIAYATSWAAAATSVIIATAPFIAIVVAVGAVTAAVIWAYQNVGWFHDTLDAIGRFVTDIVIPNFDRLFVTWQTGFELVSAVVTPIIKNLVSRIGTIIGIGREVLSFIKNIFKGDFKAAWEDVKDVFLGVWDLITSPIEVFGEVLGNLKDTIFEKAAGIFDPIKDAFAAVVVGVIEAWNSIDFGINISIPSWVPKVGGKGFKIDDIFPDIPVPQFHAGGTYIPRGLDDDGVVRLSRGERVFTPANAALGGADLTGDIVLQIGLDEFARLSRKAAIYGDRAFGPTPIRATGANI
jgi:TP901 family phage tail tape measure protein